MCAPDVLQRYAAVFTGSADHALYGRALLFEGVPLASAVVPPGTIVFEGQVDEQRMGDW